jgi:phosphatidylserine/phosphatidylglycerophosphate/cardiolipin synthase-like enzyme
MIQNAKKEIDIANAYLILTPAIKEYLVSAIERGVRVRVYTNSTESIDEPIINQPIMESVRYLKEKGAGIYLKKGQTLHTKMFRSDSLLWVGTYNLHPRSLRYEVEKVTFINNKAQVKKMSDNFNYEISIAQKVLDVSELPEIEKNIISLLLSLFFNQL